MTHMKSLQQGYVAVVVGATGGIGSAVADALKSDPACDAVVRLSRCGKPAVDLHDEGSILTAAKEVEAHHGGADLVFDATGALSIDDVPPEKTIRRLDPANMAQHFAVNAIGPALLLKHFGPLLPRDRRGLFASLSARVGSIGDNGLGGWFSYRASKAALNQIVRTAAIEYSRTRPYSVFAALHPGTVATPLSDPFAGERDRLTPDESASMLLAVLDALEPHQSGGFFDYRGEPVMW